MAAIVSIVSRRLSPLLTLDDDTAKFIVSADSRLAAVSKLSRVRVESSKNTLHTVLPRSAGTLGFGSPVDLGHVVGQVEQPPDRLRAGFLDRAEVLHEPVPPPDHELGWL